MSLYENKHYRVTIGNISLTNGDTVQIYEVVNKITNVVEEQIPQLVVAFSAADSLNEELIKFEESKEVASVRSINSTNDTMQ